MGNEDISIDNKVYEDNPEAYMMFGDMDKPFHRPECECDTCENWRKAMSRPTHKELRDKKNPVT